MAVGGQFQALAFGPGLEAAQAFGEALAPLARAQVGRRARRRLVGGQARRLDAHQPVEDGRVEGVEQLREQLDRQRRVDAAPAQQTHRRRQHGQHLLRANGQQHTLNPKEREIGARVLLHDAIPTTN